MSAEDPVADFLAREQNDLAGLEDDDTNFMQPEPTIQTGTAENDSTNDAIGSDFAAEFEQPTFDDMNSTGDFMGDAMIEQDVPPAPVSAPSPLPAEPPKPRVEPEKIKKWREDQKDRLEKKDLAEEKEKIKWREQAEKELQEWYKTRSDQLEKSKKQNRVAEAELIRERDSEQPGQEWERITRLCEFNPKAAKNQKDVSRLRSMFLQLKQSKMGAEE